MRRAFAGASCNCKTSDRVGGGGGVMQQAIHATGPLGQQLARSWTNGQITQLGQLDQLGKQVATGEDDDQNDDNAVWWLLIGWLTYLHFECLEVFINKQKTQQTIWCGVVVIDRQAGGRAGGAPRGFDQGQVTEPLPRMEILCFFCFGYKPNLLLGIPVKLELLRCQLKPYFRRLAIVEEDWKSFLQDI